MSFCKWAMLTTTNLEPFGKVMNCGFSTRRASTVPSILLDCLLCNETNIDNRIETGVQFKLKIDAQ